MKRSWWALGRVDSCFIVVNANLAVNVPAIYTDFGLLWILATNTTQFFLGQIHITDPASRKRLLRSANLYHIGSLYKYFTRFKIFFHFI